MTYILTIGIDPTWFSDNDKTYNMSESRSEEEIQASIKKLQEGLRSFAQTTIEILLVRPGETDEWDKISVALQKRRWDGVSVGGGLRRHPDLSDYFTRLMQLAVKSNAEATFLFPLEPDDVVPAIRKFLPSAV